MTAIANDNFFGENWKYLLAAFAMHVAIAVALTITINSTSRPLIPSQLAIKAVVIDNTAKRLKREKEQAEAELAARAKAEAEEKARQQEIEAKQQEEQRQKTAAEEKKKADAQAVLLKKQADDKKKADAIKAQQAAKKKADLDAREQAQLKAQRDAEMAEEADRLAVQSSSASAAYVAAIKQRIESKWNPPASATPGTECTITLTQAPGGMVVSVQFGKCNGDKAVRESLELAANNASPLPAPSDARLFQRQVTILFRPTL